MIKDEMIEIVTIFKNDGIDKRTGKMITERNMYDIMDRFDHMVGMEGASEIIFGPEDFGLDKDASPEEIVDFALSGKMEEYIHTDRYRLSRLYGILKPMDQGKM